MFKPNPDSMRMEPTPERVLSVCRMVAQQSMTTEELRKTLTLGMEGDKAMDQVKKSIDVAKDELNLISSKDDKLVYSGDEVEIASAGQFRRFVAPLVLSRKDSTFVMFTRWVIQQNERLFTLKNWEVMAKTCGSEVSELSKLGENSVLGWRFWAAFLGLGYLSGTMFIPNMTVRLRDLFSTAFPNTYKYSETIRAEDFAIWLTSQLPEADLSGRWPLGVSAGLRTLHELGLIKLATWQDSNKIRLYYVDGDPINEFSHITVSEEVNR